MKAPRKTVLIVDDEEQLALFFKKLMEWKGYAVVTARNGKEAVDAYKAAPDSIDLILMDICMPVMSGIEAYKELKQYDSCVPVLLMSAYSPDTFEFIPDIHFIRKPMQTEDLFNAIHNVIEDSESCALRVEKD